MTKFKLNNGYLNIENREISEIVSSIIDEEFFWEFLSEALITYIEKYNDNNEGSNVNIDLKSLLNSTEQNNNKLEDMAKLLSEIKTTINGLNAVSLNNSSSNKGVVVGASGSKSKPKTKSKSRPKPITTNKLGSPSGSKNKSGMDMMNLFDSFSDLIPEE